tara:strand:+ start:616 stop:1365 length:750 start_codon:yes stop_codon:yes gene_type:complete
MENFIKIYPNSLSDEHCNYIMDLYTKHPEQTHVGKVGGGVIKKEFKHCTDLNLLKMSSCMPIKVKESEGYVYDSKLDKEIIPSIFKAVKKSIIDYNRNFPMDSMGVTGDWTREDSDKDVWAHFNNAVMLDPHSILVKKYNKGDGYFNWHMDTSHIAARNQSRCLITMWYLNDVEEGGETEFKHFKTKIKPQKGSLVVFPASWQWLHRGKQPESNDKYILNLWWCFRNPMVMEEFAYGQTHWATDEILRP